MGLLDRIGAFERYKVSPTQGTTGLLTGTGQPMSPFAQQAARNIGGVLGLDMRTPQERLGALVSKGTGTFEEKMQVAQELAKTDPIRGLQLMESFKAEEAKKQLKAADNERQQRFRTSLISRNEAIGGSEERSATIADATPEMLLDIRKEILSEEREAAIKNRGKQGRFAVGRAAGLTEDQIRKYSGLDDDQFAKVISAQEADDVMMKDAQGNLATYRVNKFGMVNVVDPETGVNKWSRAEDLGLLRAPTETRALNQAGELSSALTKAGVTSFVDLTDQARSANSTLVTNEEGRKILDEGVFVGSLLAAPINEVLLVAKAFGAEGEAIENAENAQRFMATRVVEIGNAIKMFGSGTGLSDKDAALAASAAAGKMELTEENIRELMRISDEAARKKLAIHKQVYDSYAETATPSSLAAFKVDPFAPTGSISLNSTAAGFIPTD
jgi:hypothetical protein